MPEPQKLNEEVSTSTEQKEIVKKSLESKIDNKTKTETQIECDEVTANDLKAAEQISLDLDAYNFDNFISKMRHESCKPVLENIKRFIKVFLDKLTSSDIDDMVEVYKSFYTVIKFKCLQASVWRSSDETIVNAADRANALEGLESLIMNQLHDRILACTQSERDLDNLMETKMALHAGWIEMEHLDVPEDIASSLKESEGNWMSTAVTEFQKMSVYRTPRDKLVCALNGCKIINSLINGTGMSADDFLPLLIYTLIRANPPQIYSNINYVARFRAPERIKGETAYCFTHLMAAVEFIEKMDQESLKIDQEIYKNFIEIATKDLNQREGQEMIKDEFSLNEKLDIAEAKAEEFFIKAKEVFKVTGERANQAICSFKESNLARKSMEKFNKFFKDFNESPKRESEIETEMEGNKHKLKDDDWDFEAQLAKAMSLSLMDEAIHIEDYEEFESKTNRKKNEDEEEDEKMSETKTKTEIEIISNDNEK